MSAAMRCRLGLAAGAGLIAACASAPTAPVSRPPVATVGDEAVVEQRPRPAAFSTAVLPSITRTGTMKTAAPLLQRPTAASVILKELSAGETVQVLGNLDNADGRWLSVASSGAQGWIKADQATEP